MAVIAQLPKEKGGAEGRVAVIDTEGTWRPERIVQISERFGSEAARPKYPSSVVVLTPLSQVDPKAANENILYARAENSEDQHDQLCGLSETFSSGQFRLLIIDSIMTHFRNDYHGRGELNERQGKLGQHLRKLTQMAEEFNIAVLVINQVQSDPGASALFAGVDGRKPIGGHVLAHASTTRILLRKGRGEERVAKVIDSPGRRYFPTHTTQLLTPTTDCPEKEATYIITTGGINDPDKA